MITEKQNEASRVTRPGKGAAKSASGTEGECVVIPFRQTRSKDVWECGADSQDSVPADSADEELYAHVEEVPVVCVPWCGEAVRKQGRLSSRAPLWLRNALIMAVSTLYTATAVAICLSLG